MSATDISVHTCFMQILFKSGAGADCCHSLSKAPGQPDGKGPDLWNAGWGTIYYRIGGEGDVWRFCPGTAGKAADTGRTYEMLEACADVVVMQEKCHPSVYSHRNRYMVEHSSIFGYSFNLFRKPLKSCSSKTISALLDFFGYWISGRSDRA